MAELESVAAVLESLRVDDSFHRALEYPEIRRALDHWSGAKRLDPAECEDWMSDPRVSFVFGRIRELENRCKLAGIGVPLPAVLRRADHFTLPDGRVVGKQPAPKPRKPRDIRKIEKLRCTARKGVAYRRTADFEDRDDSVAGPYEGEIICVEERRDGWVRTRKGWLPLQLAGKDLFRELVAEEKNRLVCICATGVAYRKSKDWSDRDSSQVGPREGDTLQYEEQDGEWVRTSQGWLPLFKDDEALFEEDCHLFDIDDPLRPKTSWKQQVLNQLLIMAFAIVVPKLMMWYYGEDYMAAMLGDLAAMNATDAADAAGTHELAGGGEQPMAAEL